MPLPMQTPSKLRVAFVGQPFYYSDFPSPTDSVGIVTSQIIRRLSTSYDVSVYSPTPRRAFKESKSEYEGVDYYYIPTPVQRIGEGILSKVRQRIPSLFDSQAPLFASRWYYPFYIRTIAKQLSKVQADIVHIHNFSQFVPVIRAFNPGIKIVLHMHCQWLSQLDKQLIKKRLDMVDLIVGCSEFITQKIRLRFPEYSLKSHTIYNGVDQHFFYVKECDQQTNIPKTILFVGRISPEKGVHDILDAFERVLKVFPHVHLNLIGSPGSLPKEFIISLSKGESAVENLASFYDRNSSSSKNLDYITILKSKMSPMISSKVTFLGSIPHNKLHGYYQHASILVNASLSEALGMPILEAMASSLPVVASDTGGIPEAVIDGETGILFEPGNSSDLADALLLLLHDDRLRADMSRAGQQRALKLFNWDRVVDRLILYYQSLFPNNG